MSKLKIGVIGAGAWGTSFANYLANIKKYNVLLWAKENEVVDDILEFRENKVFLPNIKLSENLIPTNNLKYAIENSDILIIAVPSKFCPQMYDDISKYLSNQYVVSLTKGLDEENIWFLSELMEKKFPQKIKNKIAILSGPSFAKELANNHPTAVVVASKDEITAQIIQEGFSSDIFRIYITTDVRGVELGGALKNVIAIASGIASGMGFGYNSVASLITRGNIEIIRLGLKLGAKEQTFLGLSGIGDLMLTCFGPLSRNRTFGYRVGRGENMDDILKNSKTVVEGLTTVKTALKLAEKHKVEMPITRSIYEIVYEKLPLKEAVSKLMKRSLKREWNIK